MTIDQQFSNFAARLHAFIERTSTGSTGPRQTPTDADNEFNALALDLFALQRATNSGYETLGRSRIPKAGQIRHWRQIPAAPTAAFKSTEFTTLPPEARTTAFHSSGTTEQKLSRHFHNTDSLAVYEASLLPWFRAHALADWADFGRDSRLQVICLTPPAELVPHSSLAHMFATIVREFGASDSFFAGAVDSFSRWTISVDHLVSLLENAGMANRPMMLLGTAFNFVHLVDELAESGLRFRLPPGSRVMETGGYKGRSRSIPKEDLHDFITDRLGISRDRIICEYGMTELSSQAYDLTILPAANASRVFHFPSWARIQIVSPETGREVAEGETGLLRVFDLANVRSALAIQTEDLVVRRGDGFELIGRAVTAEARGCSLMTVHGEG